MRAVGVPISQMHGADKELNWGLSLLIPDSFILPPHSHASQSSRQPGRQSTEKVRPELNESPVFWPQMTAAGEGSPRKCLRVDLKPLRLCEWSSQAALALVNNLEGKLIGSKK